MCGRCVCRDVYVCGGVGVCVCGRCVCRGV